MKQRTLLLKKVFEIVQATKEKVGQIKDCVALTLGASNEKAQKDDEVGKDEAQYDVVQEKYDSSVGSILEQLKQKAIEFFRTTENAQKKVGETKESVGSTVDETKQKAFKIVGATKDKVGSIIKIMKDKTLET
jgi:hypothetical protein